MDISQGFFYEKNPHAMGEINHLSQISFKIHMKKKSPEFLLEFDSFCYCLPIFPILKLKKIE